MSPTTSSDFIIPVQNPENSVDKISYLELRERYQKTSHFAMLHAKKRRLNVVAFLKGINVTFLKDSESNKKTDIISINLDDVGVHFYEHVSLIFFLLNLTFPKITQILLYNFSQNR
jgi:hypothetical protein